MKVLKCAHQTISHICSQEQYSLIGTQSRGHQLLGICFVSFPKLPATVNLLHPECLVSKLSFHGVVSPVSACFHGPRPRAFLWAVHRLTYFSILHCGTPENPQTIQLFVIKAWTDFVSHHHRSGQCLWILHVRNKQTALLISSEHRDYRCLKDSSNCSGLSICLLSFFLISGCASHICCSCFVGRSHSTLLTLHANTSRGSRISN